MHVRCDAGHTWMNAWIDAFPHPYHAVTDQDGKAMLTAIPPGTYQVAVWHETLGKEAKTVTIKAGETASLRFEHLTAAADTTAPKGNSK
jgi:hypothetical protein